jgi:tripartite ATP-independent transporter DctP family solute receptor
MSKTRIFLAALLLIVVVGNAESATVFRAGDVHGEGYPTVVAMQNMGKKLEAATNGRLSIRMFPGATLGNEREMIEQAQVGALHIVRISVGAVGPVVPDVNVFNMPFVFRDEAHMRKVIDGPIGEEILARITASPARLVGLGWMDAGTRNLYTKRAVRNPAELRGLKIRVMGNPLFVDTMNAMGGNGISMGFGELFGALQTGVVDGAENNEPTYVTQNHHTLARFYNLTGHLIIPEIFAFSKVAWDRLSREDQALIRTLAREAQLEQRRLWDEKVAASRAQMRRDGVTIVEADKKAFYDATAAVRARYSADFRETMNRIEAVR